MGTRDRTIITLLRKQFPGKWTYDRQGFIWRHESGWYVYKCAVHSPRYDGDDDNYETQYRRSDTHEALDGLKPGFWK